MQLLSRRSKLLLVLLVLLACTELVVRGPLRFLAAADFNDFISPYTQSRALVQGQDPYSPQVLVSLWPVIGTHRPDFLAKDLADGSLIRKRGIPTAYPLTCFLLLVPLALLPWPIAYLTWLVFVLTLVIWGISCLFSVGKFEWNNWRSYAFIAFALALAPLHTGLAAGSIAIAAVSLCGIAVAQDYGGKTALAGMVLGLAVCLKPQIGLPFLVFYLLNRRWRLVGIAAVVAATTGALPILRLAMSRTPWAENYRIDNKVLLVEGMLGDFTERNPIRYGLVNLQVLLYSIVHHPDTANFLALVISAVLFTIWVALVLRKTSCDVLLSMSTLAVLSLLPVYHRFYDSFLLVFPLTWCLQNIYDRGHRAARTAIVLMVPFLVPGGSLLEQVQGRVPTALAHSWVWECIAMPHQIWLLLVLGCLLLWRMASEDRASWRLEGTPSLPLR